MIARYLKWLVATAESGYMTNMASCLRKLNITTNIFCDVGCYDGKSSFIIANAVKAKHIYGVDKNVDALKTAKDIGISTVYTDINDNFWAIEDNKFDFVYSNQVIEHLYSVDNFMLNIKRITKPDGYILISTENLAGWHNCIALLLGYQPFSSTNICTKKWSIGNPFSIVTDGHNDPMMVHRAVFTNYAFRDFLKLYECQVIKYINGGYYPVPNHFIGNLFARIDPRHSVYMAALVKNIK